MIIDDLGRKIEGYWYSKYEPKYPKPVVNALTQDQANQIADLIKKKQRGASRKQYRGFSTSRVDKSVVGSAEFSRNGWVWPDGFGEHYVRKYRVKPSSEFLDFIGYKDN